MMNKKRVAHFSQFISVKVKKNFKKSQAQFREKLRKLRLRQNDSFLIKKRVLVGKVFSTTSLPKSFSTRYWPQNFIVALYFKSVKTN